MHGVVGGGLVPHPGDGGGLCTLLDWDGLGAGYGAAAHGNGVAGDACGERGGDWLISRVKVEKGDDLLAERIGVGFLLFLSVGAAGLELFLVGGSLSFDEELEAVEFYRFSVGPNSERYDASAFLFLDRPSGSGGFDAAGQGGVARRK